MIKYFFMTMGIFLNCTADAMITQDFSNVQDMYMMEQIVFSVTTIPMLIVDATGETLSISDKILELEMEINAGPENYYYLRALANQISADPKYNGDTKKALEDVIIQVKEMIQQSKY